MATVNSTGSANNTFAQYGIKNKGIGGLATGLDTDSLVEALTAGTRSKISAQSQKKQLLNWKVTAYRSMATALTAYQKKYLSYTATSSTNLMSNTFFSTYKATSSSDKISVTASASSLSGDFTIDRVAQLASAEALKNKTSLSSDLTLGVKADGATSIPFSDFTGRVLQLDLDSSGTPKNIKLDSLNKFVTATTVDDGNGTYSGSFSSVGDGNGSYTLDDGGNYKFVGVGNGDYNCDDEDTLVYNNDGAKTTTYTLNNSYTDDKGTHTLEDELNRLVTDTFGTKNNYDDKGVIKGTESKVKVSIAEDGTITLNSDASKISVASDCNALGAVRGQTNRVDMSTKLGAIPAFKDALVGDVLKFSINGVEISVNKNDTLTSLKSKIDSSAAGVRFDYNQYTDEFIITSKTTGAGSNIDIRDTQGNLMNTLFGAQSGNGIGTNWLMSKDTPTGDGTIKLFGGASDADLKKMAQGISNLEMSVTIDGVTKTVKADSTAIDSTRLSEGNITSQDILNALNKGIQNSFSGTTVYFKMAGDGSGKVEMASSGAAGSVAYSASSTTSASDRNALAVMGISSSSIGNTVLDMGYDKTITAANSPDWSLAEKTLGGNTSGTLNLTINGETKEIEIFAKPGDDVLKTLNEAVKKAFGADIASKVSFSSAGDKLTLTTKDSNMAVNISHGVNIGDKVDIYAALGFTGTSVNNVNTGANSGVSFSGLIGGDGLNGTLTFKAADGTELGAVDYDSSSNLQDFLAKINDALGDPSAASIVNGQLSIKSGSGYINVSDSGNLLKNFFGINNINEGQNSFVTQAASFEDDQRNVGKDAEIVVNGKTLSYSSNTFTMNGTTVTVNNVSGADDSPINVNVKSDPTEVIDRLKSWIEDYNGLIATLNSVIYESKSSGYTPLTDEQKASMTEDQIKTWESEAKKGILRNAQTLAKIVNDMRAAMYQKVESAGISLFDIGITTGSYSYTDIMKSGQLEITDETKLREMLEKDPDKVRMLFTDPNEGLAVKMNSIITAATNTSSVNRGSLVRLAGTEMLTGDNSSTLGKQIDEIDKYVSTLTTRLQTEYDRYWKKFSALETAIQRMNSQSSWLSQS